MTTSVQVSARPEYEKRVVKAFAVLDDTAAIVGVFTGDGTTRQSSQPPIQTKSIHDCSRMNSLRPLQLQQLLRAGLLAENTEIWLN